MTAVAVEHGSSFERVLSALEQAGRDVRRRGSHQASAQCPAHEDGEPSLSITWKDGKTLLHCFNGCTDGSGRSGDPSRVLAAIGLTEDDLFDEPRPRRGDGPDRRPPRPRRNPRAAAPGDAAPAPGPPRPGKKELLGRPLSRWRVTAEYIYTDENGEPLGKVVREQREHEHGYAKRFWQQHWIGQCTRHPCTAKRNGRDMVHESGWGRDAPARKVLYNLPEVRTAIAAGHEVWLPEGEKDADALNEHFRHTGYAAVATTNASGARSWRPEYAEELRGAHVVIVEDNDPPQIDKTTGEVREPAGRARTRKLAAALDGVAASARIVHAIAGKDSFDHLAAGHTARDFEPLTLPPADGSGPDGTQAAARAETAPPAEAGDSRGRSGLRLVRGEDGAAGGRGGGGGTDGPDDDGQPNNRVTYLLRHGELVLAKTYRDGTVSYDVVLGCDAQIIRVDQKILDEGETPVTTGYLLRLEHNDHPGDIREIRVSRKSWDSGDWLHDLPWTGVAFDSSRNGIAKVRDAIRAVSPVAAPTVVHGAPGWIRDRDGHWLYVHAGGALGAAGPAEIAADLPVKLEHYALPAPPATAEELCAAADHSVGLLAELPARIGAPLAGLAYRAAVSRMGPPVTLIGPPGGYKTSMAKVTLHHFAPDLPWDVSVLSMSERGATGNAAAKLMNITRDTLLLADDAAPDRSMRAAAERVASIVRLQYNGETRDRLDREAELQRPAPPRGSLMVSAEVGPSAASAAQRTLLVPFTPGLISEATRIRLWERESRHGRAAAMASFICWQAGQREQLLARTEELTAQYAQAWTAAGHSERTAEVLAHLAVGWRLMLDHLADRGAYSAGECAMLWEKAWAGLDEAGRTQADPDEPADPAAKILARLRTGLLGRYGHLTAQDGGPPEAEEAVRYGWAVDTFQSRSGITGDKVAVRLGGSEPVGCFATVGGERRLWLVPELALIMLRKVSSQLGEPFEETVKSVSSALHQAGVGLAVTEVPSTGMLRRAAQRSMPGSIPGPRRPWVWDIPESALYEEPPGSRPGPASPGPPPAPDGPGSPQPDNDGSGAPNVGDRRLDGGSTPDSGQPAPHEAPEEEPCTSSKPDPGASSGPAPEPGPAPETGTAQDGEEDGVSADRPRSPRFITYWDLLDLAQEDHVRTLATAELRSRYIQIGQLREPLPCRTCGNPTTTLIGDIGLHESCPDPVPAPADTAAAAPGSDRAGAPQAGSGPGRDDGKTREPAAAPPRAQDQAGKTAPRPQGRGNAELSGDRWRAPAAVIDATGIYLPGGERLRLPAADIPHAGILADWPDRLKLGWGGGKLPPHTGQLWLTASFLQQVAGLPVPGPGISGADLDALLTEAARSPWITTAVTAGWQISEASKERLGHRMRIWSGQNRAGAQLVFLPYIAGDVALLDGNPHPAALAARLEKYAQLTGVPYGRSAAYSGHDLIPRIDARRKIVLDGPASPAPAHASVSGIVSSQRAPSADEAKLRFLHSFDATAAWLSAAKGTELGVGSPEHRADKPEFDPRLPGLWRFRPPEWGLWAIPDPFKTRRPRRDGTIWAWTPLPAMAAELLDADIQPEEAWVWTQHTQYLAIWARQLDGARRALEGPPPSYKPEDPDDAAVLAAVKDTYSAAITLFGSPQLAGDADAGKPAHRLYRPDWTGMILATAGARLYRKVLAVSERTGKWPVAIDRDNLLYASDIADPDEACPDGLVPGQDKNPTGNGLGQVKNKGSALMSEAAPLLAAGKFSFDHLIPREEWDPVHGGRRAGR